MFHLMMYLEIYKGFKGLQKWVSSVSLDEKPKDNFVVTNGFTANVPNLKKLTR